MTTKSNAVLSNTTPTIPMFDESKTGPLNWAWLKFFQNIRTVINNTFNQQGQIVGPIAPGVVVGNTDNLTDGTGHPLAGGKEAYLALVTSTPAVGDVLEWDGTNWVPAVVVNKVTAGAGIAVSAETGDVTISSTATAGYSLGGTLTGANIVLGAGAGSGATLVLAAGSDGNHQIKVLIGSSPTVNAPVFTVTFTTSRGHVTYPIIQCVAVDVGHALVDLVAGAAANATSYQAFNPGVTAGVNYNWNISAP